tara:strand:- start:255 stop:1064 length:810 start_codon:yes stop_codon:yes gene_type:complete
MLQGVKLKKILLCGSFLSSLSLSLLAEKKVNNDSPEQIKKMIQKQDKNADVTIMPKQVIFRKPIDASSYAMGYKIGTNLKSRGVDLNIRTILSAIKEAYEGKPSAISPEQSQQALKHFQEMVKEKRKEIAANNKKEGEAYLEKNKSQKGVITTTSGLQYKVLTKGSGKTPQANSKVSVHYNGRLIDGTEFDSSYKRKEPSQFKVNRVVKGWQEALKLMPVGSKWQVYIPSDLAYGEYGRPGIPPNSVLIFDMELLSFEENEAVKTAKNK